MIKDRNISKNGISSNRLRAEQQYIISKPDVSTAAVVATEDISGGDVAVATIARTRVDYPRNLLYTLVDADAGNTLAATFTVVGTDQFGDAATETVSVDTSVAATGMGTQIFKTVTSVAISSVANNAASDTASVGVAIATDVASFGLPEKLWSVSDIKNINWIDAWATKTQNIDSTSVVLARNCFRPEQAVAAADDYVITYKSTYDYGSQA